MWIIQNRYGHHIDGMIFKTPKDAEDYIAKHCGNSSYLGIVKLPDQTKLDNFG